MEKLYGQQATVTKRAPVQRINRKLKPDWKRLKKTRGRERANLGDYYVLNIYTNCVDGAMCPEPEILGRRLGVLADGEAVVEGGAAR